jgi:tetratricopeptide (TPR) repeat protein
MPSTSISSPETEAAAEGPSRSRFLLLTTCLLLAAAGGALLLWGRGAGNEPTNAGRLLARARAAMRQNHYEQVQHIIADIPPGDAQWPAGQLLAGEAAYRLGRPDDALAFYRDAADGEAQIAAVARFSAAEILRERGRLEEAERAYRDVLAHTPDDPAVHQRLAFVLGVSGRRWESRPHLLFVVKSRNWTLDDLATLGDLERRLGQRDYLLQAAQVAPDDVHVLHGLAHVRLVEGRDEECRDLLRQVVARDRDLVAAQALLGELLVDADPRAFADWHAALPPAADDHPDIWYVRGLWARREGRLDVAARCQWECVRRNGFHRRANYALGQVLAALEVPAHAQFTQRAADLSELGFELERVLKARGEDEAAMQRVCESMESLGRVWEANAWARTAQRFFPAALWPDPVLERTAPQLAADPPQMLEGSNLAFRHDLSGYPDHTHLPHRDGSAVPAPASAVPLAAGISTQIRFEQEQDVGLDFVYFNAADESTGGARMMEQSGGGVGVLDLDGDTWPDVYFTQGAEWEHGAPRAAPSADRIDRLYRNLAGRAFVDVTEAARLAGDGFGQGLAVGDFDNDGFADLYVANVGPNRLFLNNGDGTFADVTHAAGLDGDAWTTSCLIADLNADGLPDLFDVNYVSGRSVYEMICGGKACGPKTFDGTLDRLLVSRGDGTFEDVPVDMPARSAKGLGIVAADLEGQGRLSLYIANDQEPNFLLSNTPSDEWSNVRLRDEGFVRGLAVNEDGLPLGSMGIAADDVDGDGRIDFFVSNFADEYNNLYLQQSPGLFVDRARAGGLHAAGFDYVGWGAQFLDADCDGQVDLVLANGHIDDYTDEGGGYEMPTQFFRNVGEGRFLEPPAGACGEYFTQKFLGRSLARLDWNGDGLMDFVVSNIAQPAALLSNRSLDAGRFLNVRLRAGRSARDAIGTVVEVQTGETTSRRQLTAGDGYLCSNERLLQFGLGSAEQVATVRVHWPSGRVTRIDEVPADATLSIVEGASRIVVRDGGMLRSVAIPAGD